MMEDTSWYKFLEGRVVDGVIIAAEKNRFLANNGCKTYFSDCPSKSFFNCEVVGRASCSWDGSFRGTCQKTTNGCGN